MSTTTITSKGQITLPKEVREHFHLHEGDRLEFMIDDQGRVEMRPLSRSIQSLFGLLHRPGARAVSVKEMNEAIGRFHAEENGRILKGKV
jgi:antitoxin PrlF